MAYKHKKRVDKGEQVDPSVDYEPTKPAKDADKVPADQNEADFEIDVENGDNEDFREQIAEFSDDPDVVDDFTERQILNTGGERLLDTLEQNTMQSPVDSAGDVDADWDYSLGSGDETLGGDSPTPDQNVVDDLGDAAGISYGVEEPLDSEKINDRDRDRWELNPASADDQDFTSNLPLDEADDEEKTDAEDDCDDEDEEE